MDDGRPFSHISQPGAHAHLASFLASVRSMPPMATVTAPTLDSTVILTLINHPPPPVLVGGLIALFLSGAVFMQVIIYFQIYQKDMLRFKLIVVFVWILDVVHSVMVCIANWMYLVASFGDPDALDHIQWSISLTIALTALTTFVVHSFFIHRIHKMSNHKWFITVPLVALALLRVVSAIVTTAEMLRLQSYTRFIENYAYIFTLGLAVSASLDLLITAILCFYLQRGRPIFTRMNRMLDMLTVYTVETGLLTCVATALSLFFWLFMRHNFVFLGMHLAINKLYANSLLASLNARKSIATKASGSSGTGAYPLPVMFHPAQQSARNYVSNHSHASPKPLQVTIDVQQTIQHDSDDDLARSRPFKSESEDDLSTPRRESSITITDGKN